jgi:hypothetical protein
MPLDRKDQRHLTAAQGYLELGMLLEANEELEEIDGGSPFAGGARSQAGV